MERSHSLEYSPLASNCVRLLRLSKTSSSHALETVNLSQAPPYFALSYAWAGQANDVPIKVNDQVLRVSSSLARAIDQLRVTEVDGTGSNNRVQRVWVDRICINQDDLSELSRQIGMMKLIFSQAIRTLIWLGPDDDPGPSTAWTLIDQIYGTFRKENPRAKFPTDIPFRMYSDQSHAASSLPSWDDRLWHHLRRLFDSPWFTRTWIVQEVVLSQDDPIILHGQQTYPWRRLAWASSWLRRSGYLRLAQIPNGFQNVDTMSSLRQLKNSWRLDALLVVSSIKCHATDQRDKVYGILGLAAENQGYRSIPDALRPDYALDVIQIYTKTALFMLETSKSLAILTRANGVLGATSQSQRTHQLEQLPSWVPNWSDWSVSERDVTKTFSWIGQPVTVGSGILGFPEHYNAAAGLPLKLLPSPDPHILRLGGIRADTVASAVQFDNIVVHSFQQQHHHVPSLLWLWGAHYRSRSRGDSLAELVNIWVKATTADHHLLGGRTADQILVDGAAYLHGLVVGSKCSQSCSASFTSSKELTDKLRVLSMGGSAEVYAALASNYCFNRKLVMTSEGRIGICPIETRSGDLVFVLPGGGVPYVLREQEGGFVFVGEAYISGLMDGEAIEAWEQGTLISEALDLI